MEQEIQRFVNNYEAKNTQKNYKTILTRFMQWGNERIPDGNQWVEKYKYFLKEQNLKNKTINLNLAIVGKFIKAIEGRKLEYDRLKETNKPIEFLTSEEIKKILEGADKNLRAVLMFMLDTGVRVSEVTALGRTRFDGVIPYEFIINGKGSKQRIIVISNSTHKILEELSDQGLIFGKEWSVKKIQYHLKLLEKKLGFRKKLHPHIFRHTFATQMIWQGAEITEVQKMLGHAYLNTTQAYVHITEDRLRKTWAKYHSVVQID